MVSVLFWLRAFEGIENKSYDWRVNHFATSKTADDDIIIITVDESSLNHFQDVLGRWPWERKWWAEIIKGVFEAEDGRFRPKLVVFDILFLESADEASAGVEGAENDGLFADAMLLDWGDSKRQKVKPYVFLPFLLSTARNEERPERFGSDKLKSPDKAAQDETQTTQLNKIAIRGISDNGYQWPEYPRVILPTPVLRDAAAGTGHVALEVDSDGIARRVHAFAISNGKYFLPLSIAVAAHNLGVPLSDISLEGDILYVGDQRAIPLGETGEMLIKWNGSFLQAHKRISIGHLIQYMIDKSRGDKPAFDPAVFKDKTVFIAGTAAGTYDLRATPFEGQAPGVTIHANALDTIMNEDYITRTPRTFVYVCIILISLLVAISTAFTARVWVPVLVTIIIGTALLLISAVAYKYHSFWFDLMPGEFACFASFAFCATAGYFSEGRQRRQVMGAFVKYLSPEVLKEIMEKKGIESLRADVGERIDVSILFSDIRNFTTMSENMEPEEVVAILNEYLTAMVDIIFEHRGTVDKFVGDAIMAIWGAPDKELVKNHALESCRVALKMLRVLEGLKAKWKSEGKPEFDIGVGINSGPVVVGNIGSDKRLDYTCIGDNVNLAARLESENKKQNTRIIISEYTLAKAGNMLKVRDLGSVKVKGKENSVQIYELLDIDE